MDRYPISSERSVNREVRYSPQLEVGRESSGVALEELCPVSLHHRMEVTVKAKLAIWKHTLHYTHCNGTRNYPIHNLTCLKRRIEKSCDGPSRPDRIVTIRDRIHATMTFSNLTSGEKRKLTRTHHTLTFAGLIGSAKNFACSFKNYQSVHRQLRANVQENYPTQLVNYGHVW